MQSFTAQDRGFAGETNGLADGSSYHRERGTPRRVDWTAPGLTITRLRLLSDPGCPWWDVSYCHGVIGSEQVDVVLPFSQLPRAWKRALYAEAKATRQFIHGVFAAVSTHC
jgi:hypothetical protein